MRYPSLLFFVLALSSLAMAQVSPPQIDTVAFANPIAEQRADPWVYQSEDGTYYLIATVPAYDRIVMRSADSINGLREAEEKTLWTAHPSGVMSRHIWAPELHRVDGTWYIYFAAAEASDIWKIRMWALSNDSEDPMTGEWKEEGQITTDRDGFALDATTFEHNDERYLIWAERDGDGTSLILSEMSNPTTLTGPQVVITKPEYSWERIKYNVNEGPAVIKRDGRIFVTYSASATNDHYAVGLLWIDQDANLLDTTNWHKSPGPVFSSNEEVDRYGPGHNSFTTDADGNTVMIYHARDYKEIDGPELENPDRATRARVIRWTASGFPDFRQAEGDGMESEAGSR
ncbi:GH43 family beta-xylosidase [Neolewinella xylanilytica]|uniref:GH43 family beta-xylosidase n=1 Tax=Neolewinella xylanilytica TaxID=1514080 RepID=A0A2S6I7G5_9BACT|nr:family 43 glycosylhydrolase [Neolewinella xylanilytica]PPK87369.1 GH43 family beta-xylosidase [Neolewinella xylanilytica]